MYKSAAWRDRDRSDIERLLYRYADRMDLGRIRALVAQLSEALEKPERIAEFDALVARVRGTKTGG